VKPKLLLHICCGPCATEVIHRLRDEFEVVGWFYNPNIDTDEEYHRRLAAVQQLSAAWHVLVDVGPYDHARFVEAVVGLGSEPEGGRRCEACFRLRLAGAARAAEANGCTVVASTLTIGRNKRAEVVNPIGREACRRHGVEFHEADWKKQDGFSRSVGLARALGLYRQGYCGCEFSRRDR
jgi:predicted adenine nucleotide alpha hydrolase (AANH) superfamily ATPase